MQDSKSEENSDQIHEKFIKWKCHKYYAKKEQMCENSPDLRVLT